MEIQEEKVVPKGKMQRHRNALGFHEGLLVPPWAVKCKQYFWWVLGSSDPLSGGWVGVLGPTASLSWAKECGYVCGVALPTL